MLLPQITVATVPETERSFYFSRDEENQIGQPRASAAAQCGHRGVRLSIHSSTLPRWVLAFVPTRVASSAHDDVSSATSFPPLSQEERHQESKIFPTYPWPRTESQAHSCCKGIGASHIWMNHSTYNQGSVGEEGRETNMEAANISSAERKCRKGGYLLGGE